MKNLAILVLVAAVVVLIIDQGSAYLSPLLYAGGIAILVTIAMPSKKREGSGV